MSVRFGATVFSMLSYDGSSMTSGINAQDGNIVGRRRVSIRSSVSVGAHGLPYPSSPRTENHTFITRWWDTRIGVMVLRVSQSTTALCLYPYTYP